MMDIRNRKPKSREPLGINLTARNLMQEKHCHQVAEKYSLTAEAVFREGGRQSLNDSGKGIVPFLFVP